MPQDRRNHQLSREYRALFTAVQATLAEADPIKLLQLGASADEYAPEVGTIRPRLRHATGVHDVATIVHEEFVRWFGPGVAGDRAAYQSISDDIWKICEQQGAESLRSATNVHQLIAAAEEILPSSASPDGELDPRWQPIIAVSEFLDNEPEAVWPFIVRWGSDQDEDVRSAVATCLLEHLLERHFLRFIARTEEEVHRNSLFADTFSRCAKFGQSIEPENSVRFDALRDFVRDAG